MRARGYAWLLHLLHQHSFSFACMFGGAFGEGIELMLKGRKSALTVGSFVFIEGFNLDFLGIYFCLL